jgi:hypothetical protein
MAAVAATAGKKTSIFSTMSAHSLGSNHEDGLLQGHINKVTVSVSPD